MIKWKYTKKRKERVEYCISHKNDHGLIDKGRFRLASVVSILFDPGYYSLMLVYFRIDSISLLKSFRAQTTGTGYRGLASFLAQVIIWSMSLS